ncbi:MAG: glycosyltransferase family 92 protein [Parachlamydiaceae bacterium]
MKFLFSFIFLIISLSLPAYQLCVCAIFQNESRFLKEWIDYHLLVGVEHFWLYNNESDDAYREILQPYIDAGTVDLYEWPNKWPQESFFYGCQAYAYQDALSKAKKATTWLAVIDVDEFIVPLDSLSVLETLRKHYRRFSGVGVHWQTFGTSGVDFIHPGELMIEKLTRKANKNNYFNGWVKSIFKVKDVVTMLHPHVPVYLPGKFQVNTNKEQDVSGKKIVTEHLQLNHYWTRDKYHLHQVKLPRYIKWGETYNAIMEKANALDSEDDYSIQKFVPYLKS